MNFCTAINCMDGRVQQPVIDFFIKHKGIANVDMITEAGPVKILAKQEPKFLVDSILARIKVSVNIHKSKHIAIVAHDDCAGNPIERQKQEEQLEQAKQFLEKQYPQLEIIKLWVTVSKEAEEIL